MEDFTFTFLRPLLGGWKGHGILFLLYYMIVHYIFRNPVETVTSFDRPNLCLEVNSKGNGAAADLQPLLKKDDLYAGPTIVYCNTKKATEETAKTLRSVCIFGLNSYDEIGF